MRLGYRYAGDYIHRICQQKRLLSSLYHFPNNHMANVPNIHCYCFLLSTHKATATDTKSSMILISYWYSGE